MTKKKQPRRKKIDWLRAALAALKIEGIEGIRVERLARDLNVAKSGFYWHFKDRNELHRELLDYWDDVSTQVVTANPELAGLRPADRLRRAMQVIWEHDLGGYDLAFRAWGQGNQEVLTRVNRVYDQRLAWAQQLFGEAGFKGTDLEMRARLFVGYHSWERTTFPRLSKAQGMRLIKRRVNLFLRP